jgi:hypothetical protein
MKTVNIGFQDLAGTVSKYRLLVIITQQRRLANFFTLTTTIIMEISTAIPLSRRVMDTHTIMNRNGNVRFIVIISLIPLTVFPGCTR